MLRRPVGLTIFLSLFSVFAAGQGQTPGNASVDSDVHIPRRVDVTPPRVIFDPEPDYTQEARDAGIQGSCGLEFVVGEDGKPRDIRVTQHLGKGLDEKAIEAVRRWRFEPAKKDGKPLAVHINVNVNFMLYGPGVPETKPRRLMKKAEAGDAKAQLALARLFFEGREVPRNDTYATAMLTKAANQGLPAALFLTAERANHPVSGNPDYVSAYTWYTLAHRSGEKKSDKALKELAGKMTPEQIAEAQTRVANWKPTSSK